MDSSLKASVPHFIFGSAGCLQVRPPRQNFTDSIFEIVNQLNRGAGLITSRQRSGSESPSSTSSRASAPKLQRHMPRR